MPSVYPLGPEFTLPSFLVAEVVAYIDGFNLYNGIRAKYGRSYLWLDLFELVSRMRRDDTVVAVRYFTAIVRGEPDAARRQETYLAALAEYRPQVKIIRGHFRKKTMRCRNCGSRWICACEPPRAFTPWVEKLSDVALGTAMVEDAARGLGDLSVLVSTDSDFRPAIESSLRLAPNRPVMVACPPGRVSPHSKLAGSVVAFPIREEHLRAALLPDPIAGPRATYHRPEKWA